MTAYEPVIGGRWHLGGVHDEMSLCGVYLGTSRGRPRFAKRNPHKIDDQGGERCRACWAEWRTLTAASIARQDQHEAGRA